MPKHKIVIFGSTGLIGNFLYKQLSCTFNVKTINRDDLWKMITQDKVTKERNCLCIINCIYDFSDLSVKNNINYLISKKILEFKNHNEIKLLINLSSLSVHGHSTSNYSRIKKNIENIFKKYSGCYSIRLGLPILDKGFIGIIKKIRFIQMGMIFLNFKLSHKRPLYQRVSNLLDFSVFIESFIYDYKNYPNIFSFSSKILINFNTLLKSLTPGFDFFIKVEKIRVFLKLMQFFKIPFPFKDDNLDGLINSPLKLEYKNYE